MYISNLTPKSPPSRTPKTTSSSKEADSRGPEDAFESSERGRVSLGAGVLLAVSLLGMTACTPPPGTGQEVPEHSTDDIIQAPTSEVDLAKEESSKPMTELEIRQRELELREREVAVRERELQISQQREKGEARLRALQEQREAREKAERIGKGIGDTITILDAIGGALKDEVNEVLR